MTGRYYIERHLIDDGYHGALYNFRIMDSHAPAGVASRTVATCYSALSADRVATLLNKHDDLLRAQPKDDTL